MADATSQAIVQAAVGTAIDATAKRDKMRFAQKLQHETFNYQNAKNREETEYYWNRYNSPLARKQAFKEAGLNPDMLLGNSSQTGAAGTMTPAPSASPTPISELSAAVQAATAAEKDKMSMNEMKRAHKYNLDAQSYDLLRAEADSRKADAEAVKAEKEAGVFDERRYEEKRREADAHRRHLKDIEEIENHNTRELRKIAVSETLASLEAEKFQAGESIRDAQYELLKGQKRYVQEQTGDLQDKREFLQQRGFYPGSGASLSQTLNEVIDAVMTDDPESANSGRFNSFRRRFKNLGYRSDYNQRIMKEMSRYYPEKFGKTKDGYYYRK